MSSCGNSAFPRLPPPSPDRVVLTPYVVDNDWWSQRAAVRRAWGVPEDAPVVLFCVKLQSWNGPLDLLRAFAASSVRGAHLVFAGEGRLRLELQAETLSLGLNGRVRFIGLRTKRSFRKYTGPRI